MFGGSEFRSLRKMHAVGTALFIDELPLRICIRIATFEGIRKYISLDTLYIIGRSVHMHLHSRSVELNQLQ